MFTDYIYFMSILQKFYRLTCLFFLQFFLFSLDFVYTYSHLAYINNLMVRSYWSFLTVHLFAVSVLSSDLKLQSLLI